MNNSTSPALLDIPSRSSSAFAVPDAVPAAAARSEILFIEDNIEDYLGLACAAPAGAQVHILDSKRDGLAQIGQILAGSTGVDALHILSHGAPGSLNLGALTLTNENLDDYASVLFRIADALSENAAILLYGCHGGMGDQGAALVSGLAALTGAGVAASAGLTGSAELGGDWLLEHRSGVVEASALRFADFAGVLSVAGIIGPIAGGPNFGAMFTDGEGGSTDIPGVTYQFYYADANSNVMGNVYISNYTSDPNYKSLTSSTPTNLIKQAIFKTADQQNFQLQSFTLQDISNLDGATWLLTGYDNGVAVDGATYGFLISGSQVYTILPPGFSNVDEVRISVSGTTWDPSNGLWASTFNSFVVTDPVDIKPPTAAVVVSNNALHSGSTSLVTVTFSEAVSDFSNASLVIPQGSTLSTFTSTNNITWTATLTPATGVTIASSAITLDMDYVHDLAGNAGSGTVSSNNYAIDTAPPGATVVVSDSELRPGETATVTITFTEAVSDFTLSDLNAQHASLSNLVTSNNITWTATLTPDNAYATGNVITLANQSVTDAAGNTNASAATSSAYTVAALVPTATILVADNALKAGATSQVTITFSEAVTGFDLADLHAQHGTLSDLATSDNIIWTATLTPDPDSTASGNSIQFDTSAVTNALGNAGNAAVMSNSYAIDTAAPGATVVVDHSSLSVGDSAQVTIIFTEAVNGFNATNLHADHGTLGNLATSDGGTTWTATLTPDAGVDAATNKIVLDLTGVTDLAGNAASGHVDSNNYSVDTSAPGATITLGSNALLAGQSTSVTIVFTEAVTGFDNTDLTVNHGTLSNVASTDGITWTATYTPDADTTEATNAIELTAHSYSDSDGNVGGGAVSANYTIDTARPTASVVVADGTLKAGETSLVTITFSEAVSGFDNTDLAIGNGTLSAVSTSDNITWTATLTPASGSTGLSNVITLNNTGYTDLAGNAGAGSTDSNQYTVDTVAPTATIAMASNTLASGASTLVTFTFSEAVTGFDNADLTVAHGTLSTVSTSDGGLTWTATFTASARIDSESVVVTLNNTGVQDLSGNAGVGSLHNPTVALPTGSTPDLTSVVQSGGSGNDTLIGGAGNDVLQGGRSDVGAWSFYLNAQGQLVAHHQTSAGASTETLSSTDLNHEAAALLFTDADTAMLQSLATLYATAFGRVADMGGLNYWISNGAALEQVVQAIIQSAEFTQGSGSNALTSADRELGSAQSNADLVHALYANALGTAGAAATTAEQAAWITKLDAATDLAGVQAQLLLSLSQESATASHWTGANGISLTGVTSTTEQGLIAGSGDDVLNGGAGSDLLVGGDGVDTVVYSGKLADYHIVLSATGAVTINDIASGDVDTILQIEKGQFSDGTVDLSFTNSSAASLQQLALVYETVLGRSADIGGIAYWNAHNVDALALAQQFIASSEFQAYGSLSNAAFVTLVETNALNHAPDAASVKSWTTYLDTHTRAELVAALIGTPDVVAAQFSGAGLVLV